jgi:hypothetical protein
MIAKSSGAVGLSPWSMLEDAFEEDLNADSEQAADGEAARRRER